MQKHFLPTIETPFDKDYFRRVIDYTGQSIASVAKGSGVPESTLKKILSGETADPRISNLVFVCKYINASIDRLTGLAPMRDLQKEESFYDRSMLDTAREQLKEMTVRFNDEHQKRMDIAERLSHHDASIDAHKASIEEKERMISYREKIISEKNEQIKELKLEYEVTKKRFLGVIIAFVLLIGYCVFEISHPASGLSGLFMG